MSLLFAERHDPAAGQKAAKLHLLWGPANLSDDRRRN
jgi:hypothetical protein